MSAPVAVLCESSRRLDRAKQLSHDLEAPMFLGTPLGDFPFLLAVTDERVELRWNRPSSPGPVFVDFITGPLDYRRRRGGSQMIMKAVGGSGQRILDATAGLGRDAFVLASLGCRVTALEVSPVVAALVEDGLERAGQVPELKFVCQNLDYRVGEARSFLKENQESWDAIYLDPMFPKKEKSALSKKDLQILQEFLGIPEDESEAREILDLALKKTRRVVVKRHLRAPPLGSGVSHSLKGASTRFDVYIR